MSETNFEIYRSTLIASLNSCGASLTDETVLNLAYQVDGYLDKNLRMPVLPFSL